jgi:hypothetical protein
LRTLRAARLILAAGAAALVAACSTPAAGGDAAAASPIVGRATAAVRDVTIPSGTLLHLALSTSVASDTSQVEDAVAAELTIAVVVGGGTVLPSGALIAGVVRSVERAGRVKGGARLVLDFTSVTSDGRRYAMSAEHFSRQASAAAAAGAALATAGEEVRFPSGTDVSIPLVAPLTVRVGR